MSFDRLLQQVLTAEPVSQPLAEWVKEARSIADHRRPLERAALGGARADRLGHAFVAGYFAAFDALLSGLEIAFAAGPICLAATEGGSAHPKHIQTALVREGEGWLLRGEKGFVTLAPLAERILVIAREGTGTDGRPSLRALLVPRDRAGISLSEGPSVPFAPEIPHARVTFTNVRIGEEELLPGDGYDRVLKPFRTVEDLFAITAVVGHCLAIGRRAGAQPALLSAFASSLAALSTLAGAAPDAATTHVALQGVIESVQSRFAELVSGLPEGEEKTRLLRDAPLLKVATGVRSQRFTAALSRLVP